jgi:hypothetical protein
MKMTGDVRGYRRKKTETISLTWLSYCLCWRYLFGELP